VPAHPLVRTLDHSDYGARPHACPLTIVPLVLKPTC